MEASVLEARACARELEVVEALVICVPRVAASVRFVVVSVSVAGTAYCWNFDVHLQFP